jgi:hypothetical protein
MMSRGSPLELRNSGRWGEIAQHAHQCGRRRAIAQSPNVRQGCRSQRGLWTPSTDQTTLI